jgi:rhamnosyltransferase
MKLCAVIISYYPDLKSTIDNINRYFEYVDHLIIWENTPEKDRRKYRIDLKSNNKEPLLSGNGTIVNMEHCGKVSYMYTGNNMGIGYALNHAVQFAIANEYTHILTMDQDSYWVDFNAFKQAVLKNESKYLLVAPNINGRKKKKGLITNVKACITSGSLYNLDVFKQIGLFREDFFIDGIDTEFCYRMIRNDAKLVIFAKHILIQKFGETKRKFGFLKIRSYSAFRTYYILRNHIYIWRIYPDIIEKRLKKWIIMRNIIKRIPKIVLVEDDKFKKIKSIVKGIIDGFKMSDNTSL